jgi:hypothetical protein
LLLGTLLAAEIGATLLLRAAGWEPALRFGEAAAALGAAYAASEVLLAPSHGLPLHAAAIGGALLAPRLVYRMASANAAPGWFLAGNSAAQLLLFTALALLSWRWVEKLGWPRTRRVLAGAVIACALVWFALQM